MWGTGQIGSQVLRGGFENFVCVQWREHGGEREREEDKPACNMHLAFLGSGQVQLGSDGEILGKDNCRGAGKVKGVHQHKASRS